MDKKLFYLYFLLLGMGCLFIFTASSSVAERINTIDNYFFLKKQLVFIVLSIVVFFSITLFSEYINIKIIFLCFGFLLLMLISVLIFGFSTKGARRWIYILNFSIQPSEIIKPFLIIINAFILSKLKNKYDYIKILVSFIPFSVVSILILLQPDIGMLILLFVVYISQLFLSNIKFKNIFILAFIGIFSFISCYLVLPHVRSRINTYLKGMTNKEELNYQVTTSLDAYSNANILGRGLLEGKVKNFIPDAHTDFIFPVITEEFGFIVAFYIISLYFYITLRILLKSYRENENNDFKFLTLSGLIFLFIFQTFINIGVTLNLLPTKGMTFPFLSYGGSSLIGNSIIYAFLINYTKKDYTYNPKMKNLLEV